LFAKQIDGLILISLGGKEESLQMALNAQVPVVVVDREIGAEMVDQIVIDNEQGGYLAGQYLASLNHTRIGCITGSVKLSVTIRRLTGFRRALREAGIDLPQEMVISGDGEYGDTEKAVSTLLSRKIPPTAIFAANDLMAMGAIKALHKAHLRVPEDVSVIGFDNIPQSDLMAPALTTVAQPFDELGRAAVTALLERIQNRTKSATEVVLPVKLVERESCRALAESATVPHQLLNRQLLQLLHHLRDNDGVIIGSADMRAAPGVPIIDLAVSPGTPGIQDVVQSILSQHRLRYYDFQGTSDSLEIQNMEALLAEAGLKAENRHSDDRIRAAVRTGDVRIHGSIVLW
jgi:ABC-type sugar transport system substrate-binding protein/D-ribose pyranose/furanose isomerase RbsD